MYHLLLILSDLLLKIFKLFNNLLIEKFFNYDFLYNNVLRLYSHLRREMKGNYLCIIKNDER